MCIQAFNFSTKLNKLGGIPLEKCKLLSLYRSMMCIRLFEEKLIEVFPQGEIPGSIHLYNGEEAIAAGVCANLHSTDFITSTHRGHGHVLAKGCPPKYLMAEIYGRAGGTNRGFGGSMHIYAPQYGILGTNGIVGGGIGLAVGLAYSFKHKKTSSISVTFFGDGASNMGVFYESLNLAAVIEVPVIFVCENNMYATHTKFGDVTKNTDIAEKANAFGIRSDIVDGNDVLAVFNALETATAYVRENKRPYFIQCNTYRIRGHYEGDMIYGPYRTKEEVEEWAAKCPVTLFESRLINEFGVLLAEISSIKSDIAYEIDDAVEYARSSSFPEPHEAFENVFSKVQV